MHGELASGKLQTNLLTSRNGFHKPWTRLLHNPEQAASYFTSPFLPIVVFPKCYIPHVWPVKELFVCPLFAISCQPSCITLQYTLLSATWVASVIRSILHIIIIILFLICWSVSVSYAHWLCKAYSHGLIIIVFVGVDTRLFCGTHNKTLSIDKGVINGPSDFRSGSFNRLITYRPVMWRGESTRLPSF